MIRAAAFALIALGAAFTDIVQLCPGGSVLSLHSTRTTFIMLRDCVHDPPNVSVIDWIAALAGKCCTSTTPSAFIDPRFLICHTIVPLVAPSV